MSFEEFVSMPMRERASGYLVSREAIWLAKFKKTHMTLPAAADKLGLSKYHAEYVLGKPCQVCPYGMRTRLWSRIKVDKLSLPKTD